MRVTSDKSLDGHPTTCQTSHSLLSSCSAAAIVDSRCCCVHNRNDAIPDILYSAENSPATAILLQLEIAHLHRLTKPTRSKPKLPQSHNYHILAQFSRVAFSSNTTLTNYTYTSRRLHKFSFPHQWIR